MGGFAALVRDAALLVGNDSGPAHLAAALGTPSVVVFLSGDPVRWAHGGRQRAVRAQVGCNPCPLLTCPIDHRCAARVTVDHVLEQVDAALAAEGGCVKLDLGGNVYDLTHRPLVVGILNRTRDSFYDRGVDFELDAFPRHAEQLVDDGADVLDVGARPGGVGVRGVNEDEEAELVVESLQALRRRFEVPLSVDTQRATVAAAAFDAGAVLGNDMSGFRDPGYLATAARAGAAVIATHIRLPPGVADPDPHYDDVVEDVAAALDALSARAAAAGIPAERIILDPGYDLGKSWRQTLTLLAHTSRFAQLGHPVLVAVSNKIFLGRLLDLPIDERTTATAAACAYAVARGARVMRVHDVRAGRQVADLLAALLADDQGG